MLDDGRITDSLGKTVDFKNTVIIMTSNIGSADLLEGTDEEGNISTEAQMSVKLKLREHFRPEFLNRLDEIILFKPLSKADISNIVELLIEDLNKRLSDKELGIVVTNDAKAFIIANAYDPSFGARPLKRYLQKNVETLVAKLILGEARLSAGDIIVIDKDENKLIERVES